MARHMALAGSGLGYSSVAEKSKESSSSALMAMAFGQVAGDERVDHGSQLRRRPVGRNADDAEGTHGHEGQRHHVVTAVDLKARWHLRRQVGRARRIGGGVLERHDVGHFASQLQNG